MKMNKYQEAIDRYKKVCNYNECVLTSDMNAVEALQELVEKATPKKPQLEGDGYDNEGNLIYDTWICPNCFVHFEVDYDDYDYCPCCGQALDMSEIYITELC